MSASKPTAQADAPSQLPSVDRLTELGSGKDKGSANPKEPGEKSMWKVLLQLRPLLPYLARLVPMLELAVGPLQSAGLSSDIRKAVAESVTESTAKLQSVQRDLSTAVTSAFDKQSAQLEHLEEELTRLRQASEKLTAAQSSLSKDLRSLTRLIQIGILGATILLIALIVMAGILAHTH